MLTIMKFTLMTIMMMSRRRSLTMSTILFHRLTLSHLLGATAPFQGPRWLIIMIIVIFMQWGCKKDENYHNWCQKTPQPGQNVPRARQHGLSRQHSTSNLGDFFSNIFASDENYFSSSCQIGTIQHSTPALFTGERERAVKGLIVSASPAITSDNEYKMENSIWKVLIEFVKERVFPFWCLVGFIDFSCSHAADTEGRDADSLVWLWQASHRF